MEPSLPSLPYQALTRRETYALQEPLKEGLERLQKHQVIVPQGVDKEFIRCNNFVLMPKVNEKVRLTLTSTCFRTAITTWLQNTGSVKTYDI